MDKADTYLTDEQRQLVIDFQITFGTPEGQRVYVFLEYHSGYNGRIVPTPDDTLATLGCILGKRELFLLIKDKVEEDLNKEVQTEAEV